MTKRGKKIYIHPKYIKNEKGKTTGIYLNLEVYEAIQKNLQEWDKIKKQDRIEERKAKKQKKN